ncbi:MAG: hypothetical protein ACE5QW_05415, partial [Thermoplasmata archaeon]
DILMLKFNRQEFKDTVVIGDPFEVHVQHSGYTALRGKTVRIGVFVRGCNGNISNYIDTDKVTKEAGTLDDVSFVENQAHLCAPAGKDSFQKSINDHKLDRAVIVVCSPKLHESFTSHIE